MGPATAAWFEAKNRYAVTDCGFTSACWVWTGCVSKNGYAHAGVLSSDGSQRAHRIFWERKNGPVQHGLDLDHLCRNRACVNPDHLEPVTRSENLRRSPMLGKLNPEQVREIRASSDSGPLLAKRFNVTRTAICDIRNGRTWKPAAA